MSGTKTSVWLALANPASAWLPLKLLPPFVLLGAFRCVVPTLLPFCGAVWRAFMPASFLSECLFPLLVGVVSPWQLAICVGPDRVKIPFPGFQDISSSSSMCIVGLEARRAAAAVVAAIGGGSVRPWRAATGYGSGSGTR